MSKIDIKIDRLKIRLRGISPQVARDSIAGIGDELLGQLTKKYGHLRGGHSVRIENIDSGTLKIKGNTGTSDLQRAVAARIANSVDSESKIK